ncbi:hypothetical protein AcV7_004283 [Taiwanofungus camphoratus]|nr:hypothetical protein AcV7_004283 [Antrodia cinnamomea]
MPASAHRHSAGWDLRRNSSTLRVWQTARRPPTDRVDDLPPATPARQCAQARPRGALACNTAARVLFRSPLAVSAQQCRTPSASNPSCLRGHPTRQTQRTVLLITDAQRTSGYRQQAAGPVHSWLLAVPATPTVRDGTRYPPFARGASARARTSAPRKPQHSARRPSVPPAPTLTGGPRRAQPSTPSLQIQRARVPCVPTRPGARTPARPHSRCAVRACACARAAGARALLPPPRPSRRATDAPLELGFHFPRACARARASRDGLGEHARCTAGPRLRVGPRLPGCSGAWTGVPAVLGMSKYASTDAVLRCVSTALCF